MNFQSIISEELAPEKVREDAPALLRKKKGMNQDYIPIESVDDIDVLRISVREMDKRYIDRQGNRYALRFNVKTRRPEIVQIVSNRLEARRLQQTIIQDKKTKIAEVVEKAPAPTQNAELANVQFSPDQEVFHETKFVEECIVELPRIRDSQQAALSKMRQSRIFETIKSAEFMDLTREIERECWRKIDEAVSTCKEWMTRPPSLHAILIRVANDKRKILDSIPDEAVKVESARRWEWQDRLEDTYLRVQRFGQELIQLVKSVPEDELVKVPQIPRQSFIDSSASLEVSVPAIEQRLARIAQWRRKYL